MDQLRTFVKTGQGDEAERRVSELLEQGAEPDAIMKRALVPAMDDVGQLFQDRIYFLPEMLIAAGAMKRSLAVLRPLLVDTGAEPAGCVVIGTVRADIHDIGKNLVTMALEGAGFEVVDLGNNVAPSRFVETVEQHRPDLLCMSALLTTTMMAMGETIDALDRAGLRGGLPIIVGGAPLSERIATELGADHFGADPIAAKQLARELLA